jgi:hypothetical protein
MQTRMFLFSLFAMQISMAQAKPQIIAKVKLYPMGSFDLESQIQAERPLKRSDKGKSAVLRAPVASMKTGISLRDRHLKEKLEVKKFPFIQVSQIQLTGPSKGKAVIQVKAIRKPIDFDYKEISKGLAEARFSLSLKEFEFSGISYKGVGVEDKLEVIATVPVED